MKFRQTNTSLTHIQFNSWDRAKAWKVKEMTLELNNDLTFYCTHNQLYVPQYNINVQSTWDI